MSLRFMVFYEHVCIGTTMRFFNETIFQGELMTEQSLEVSDLLTATSDTLLSLLQIVRVGFDGVGRNVSARILNEDRQLVATIALTLAVEVV